MIRLLIIPFALLLAASGGGTEPSDVLADFNWLVGPGSSNAGNPMSAPSVQLLNSQGGVIFTATDAVTVSIGNNPGNGILNGTTTVNAVDGRARWEGLSISAAGVDYTLLATSGTVSRESLPFTVNP